MVTGLGKKKAVADCELSYFHKPEFIHSVSSITGHSFLELCLEFAYLPLIFLFLQNGVFLNVLDDLGIGHLLLREV